jgi:hypothetical protein
MARAVGILSGYAIGSELLASRQVLLDPGVFLHFAMKDNGQVARVFVEIVFLRDDAHTDYAVC